MLPDYVESDAPVYVARGGTGCDPKISSIDFAHQSDEGIVRSANKICLVQISVKRFFRPERFLLQRPDVSVAAAKVATPGNVEERMTEMSNACTTFMG